jgi:hypothetical protein
MKKKGRPLATDAPRNKYIVMRVSEKERAAILQHFHSVADLRAYLLKVVKDEAAGKESKPGE